MAQTLQNQLLLAKSMNGIITFDDGAGTVISDGIVSTENLITDTMTSTNMVSTNMNATTVNATDVFSDNIGVTTLGATDITVTNDLIVPRTNYMLYPPMGPLGTTINLSVLVQNFDYDDIAGEFVIYSDAANQMVKVDLLNSQIKIQPNILYLTPQTKLSVQCNNIDISGIITITRIGKTALNTYLGSTINLNQLLQNLSFSENNRTFEIYSDKATFGSLVYFDCSLNYISFQPDRMNITSVAALNLACPQGYISFSNSDVIFNNSTLTIPRTSKTAVNTLLGSSININTLLQNCYFRTTPTRAFEIWDDAASGKMLEVDVSNNAVNINSTVTCNNGILPRASSSATDIQIGGVNQLQYRRSPSAYNVSIGENACRGYPAQPSWNTGVKNIGIGDSALQNIMGGSDNIAIGYQAMQICGNGATYGQTVTPYRNIAIGTGAQKTSLYGTDNIAIGYNCFPSNGSGTRNILLGSNVGGGLSDVADNVVIGSNAMAGTASDNGIVCIGSGAMQFASGSVNRGTFVGSEAGKNNASGGLNTFIGNNAGVNNTSGSQNVCLGTFAGRLSQVTGNYMTCIGYDSNCVQDNEFSIGSDSYSERAELTLPSKVRLSCNQTQTGVTISLTFRTNENVLLTDATTATINLPTPNTDKRSEGCKFYINRQVAGGDITINAPSGQTLALNKSDGTYTTSSSYIWSSRFNTITILCIGSTASGTTWLVLPTTIPQDSIQSFGAVSNVALAFNTNINVLITSTSTTSITLPTPTANNIGATFNIYKTYTGSNIISVVAPATQHILGDGVAAASYNFGYNQTYLILTCIASTGVITWTARGNGLYGINQQVVSNSSSVDYPLCFTTLSTSSSFNPIYGNSTLKYNPNSSLLTVSNLTVGGTLTASSLSASAVTINNQTASSTTQYLNFSTAVTGSLPINASTDLTYVPSTKILSLAGGSFELSKIKPSVIQFNNMPALITTATTLSFPLSGFYTFTMKTAASYIITLPEVTASTVGTQTFFKRIGGSEQDLNFARPNNQAVYIGRTSMTVATPTALIASTQVSCQLTAIQIGEAGAGTFTNVAGVNIFTINTQTSGTLAIGTRIYMGATLGYRIIASYQTGLGGTGSYTSLTVLATASTNVAYTNEAVYGWAVAQINS